MVLVGNTPAIIMIRCICNPFSNPLSIFISINSFSFLPLIGCNATAVVIILCIAYGMTGIAAVSLVPALGIDFSKFS